MTDRILKILENERFVARGLTRDSEGYWSASQDTNDTLKYTLDFSDWLGSDTISSVAYEESNLSNSGANTTTTVTLTISGVKGGGNSTDYGARASRPACLRTRVTTSASEIFDLTLRFYEVTR